MIEEGILAKWLATYQKSNTKNVYLSALKHFLTCVYGGSFDRPDTEYESLVANFISECKSGRDWMKDLFAYAVYLGKRPPKTAIAYMAAVRGFLEYALDVELSRKQMKKLRGRLPKGKRARTEDGKLNRKVLRRILAHCDSKGNALFLFLASSGVRIGEALKILLDDISLNSVPVKVTVRGEYTKAGDNYFSFISSEAKEALAEWLNVRGSYLQSASRRGRGLSKLGSGQGVKKIDDQRLFPFSMHVASSMWTNATRKAKLDGKDKSTGRRKFHIHMLRKFFQSQMKYAGVPEDLVEALIGHSGYLDDAYRRYSFEQIVEMYKKGEPYLLINVPTEIREIQTKFSNEQKEHKQRIDELMLKLTDANALMIKLMAENEEIRREQSTLKQKVASLETLYNKLFEMRPEELRLLLQEIDRLMHQRQKEEDKKQFESE